MPLCQLFRPRRETFIPAADRLPLAGTVSAGPRRDGILPMARATSREQNAVVGRALNIAVGAIALAAVIAVILSAFGRLSLITGG